MVPALLPFDPIEVARLEEARQALGTAEVTSEAEAIAGGWMSFEAPGAWANQACGLGLAGPVSAGEIDRLVAFYVGRGVEPKIEVCPFADPSLLAGLAARGFTLREFEVVLARVIAPGEDLAAALPHGWPAAVEVVRVDPEDDAAVRRFVDVSSSGFLRDQTVPEALEALAWRVARHPRCDSFEARCDDQVVAGGGMETGEGVACLFGASTLPPWRGRGIQQALMVRRMQRAVERGCRLVTIHSDPRIATARNASRLGFLPAYTKVVLAMAGAGLEPSP